MKFGIIITVIFFILFTLSLCFSIIFKAWGKDKLSEIFENLTITFGCLFVASFGIFFMISLIFTGGIDAFLQGGYYAN